MLAKIKQSVLQAAKWTGGYSLLASSPWRKSRLLILCYHGISLIDEHKWCGLYISPEQFRRRLELLKRWKCNVLPLADAAARLYQGSLPPRSVVITFDDGFHDFHKLALPILQDFGYPATVYQTTYYTLHRVPVFNLMVSYLLWRGAGRALNAGEFGIPAQFQLSPVSEENRKAVEAFTRYAEEQQLSPARMDALSAAVAARLDVDYGELREKRVLELMTLQELGELHRCGIDIQLHTHRHRTPSERELFLRELDDNRRYLADARSNGLNHFCYPSGAWRREFLPWLEEKGVETATTCDLRLAAREDPPLLLPRFLDLPQVTDVDFEGWVSGFSSLLPRRS